MPGGSNIYIEREQALNMQNGGNITCHQRGKLLIQFRSEYVNHIRTEIIYGLF